MLSLKLSELKAQTAAELQLTLDRALSAMLYPHDDPSYKDGSVMLDIEDDCGTTAYGGGANLVAMRYLWFLYKKATIPNFVAGHSPIWYTPLTGETKC
jgi:hypothetical protein